MAKYNVVIARRADEMLLRHTEFLSRVSLPAARKLLSAFEEVIGNLEENPFLYQIDDDSNLPEGKYRRALFLERYKVLYCIEENMVYVDAVVDCRQDMSRMKQM